MRGEGSARVSELGEGKLLAILGGVQLVNVLDFMMVMPLGPDFAQALGIPATKLGLVGGAYTAAAALSGMAGSLFLDRFDRRKALACSLLGLVLGTALGGFATGLSSLLFARVVAGAFAGPASALSLAILTDLVPAERRGRAMGGVMAAFSVASVLGVPAGLELARRGGWQMPFFAVAALGAVVAGVAVAALPSLTSHLKPGSEPMRVRTLLRNPLVLLMLACTMVSMMGNFAMIPNLATYWQFNRGFPREQLGLLYLIGGAVTFVTMQLSGRLADRLGAFRMASAGTLLFVLVLIAGFVHVVLELPVPVLFVAFMVTSTFRTVPLNSLATRVPEPNARAAFMSLNSTVQHLAAAAGAVSSSHLLTEGEHGALLGMERVASLAVLLAMFLPLLLWWVEAGLRARAAEVTRTLSAHF